ncbi:hypothetical protein E7Z59_02830 [Robertkochia marina]|uniref:TolC family protein n=1 Tax=Robertkochia marina TaxID=1227945 RepID=A0A4S3M323_9FLAO|nr:TolC family protein [Robertkochia marina]THD69280.1 hypothetical protein E7Z59_02830 [Robertkochia marina]TRZ47461.1 hypothetical protein D3A96_01765 [Robertkochia marina]
MVINSLLQKILFFVFTFFIAMIALGQESQQFRIGLMLEVSSSETENLIEELKMEIRRVVGEDAEVLFPPSLLKVNQLDLELARKQYRELQQSDADLILSFGTMNNSLLFDDLQFTKPVISMAGVNAPGLELPLKGEGSGITNFLYLVTSQSMSNDLETFHNLTRFKKAGIVLRRDFYESLALKNYFDEITSRLGIDYELIFYNNAEDVAARLSDDIDAVYLAEAFYLTDKDIKYLADLFLERKLPSFTSSFANDVESGILGTNQSSENFTRIFRRIALSIQEYISGTPLETMPVQLDLSKKLTLNINTLIRLELPLKYSLLAGTNIVGSIIESGRVTTYDLLDLIDMTLVENLQLQASQRDVDLLGQEVKLAASTYLPEVGAGAQANYRDAARTFEVILPEYALLGNVFLNQLVFSEAANAGISIQKRLREAQQERFNVANLDAILQVSALYFNALIAKINLNIQRENRDLTLRNLELAELNYQAGQSGRSDMLRFRSEMAQNTQNLIEATNALQLAYVEINRQINMPLETPITVADAKLGEGIFEAYNYSNLAEILDNPRMRQPFIEFLVNEGKTNLPEFKVIDRSLEATQRNIRYNTTGRLLPELGLQGAYNYDFNQWGAGAGDIRPKGFFTAGVNLRVPIFQQNNFSINRQTAEIQKDQLEIQKAGLAQDNETAIREVVLNLINQISNIKLSEISADAAREALELTRESYTAGAVNIVQLIDAQNNLLRAQLAQSNAIYNFLLNATQLERLIGHSFLLHTPEENAEFERRFIEFFDQY